ncbi:MAG: methionine--tRNA ligase [Myxococcota bacterium]
MQKKKPYLVTAALPYANGSIHIGHLVEHVMTDVHVRARRLAGDDVVFVCADDTHGTPIQLAAEKAGIAPEAFVARFFDEHQEDFRAFQISFDHYDSTNSEENKAWAYEIYHALKAKGVVSRRPMMQLYDEKAGRFLPDRFVKGECPNCHTKDQYGDACEACGKTYEPTDLIAPYSVVTGTKPVLRESTHLFVSLAPFAESLRAWASDPDRVGDESRNFILSWIDGGLKDWCITRDPPYFGFPVPDEPGKYFYVWADAPVGYISSTDRWSKKIGKPELASEYWRKGGAHITHVIGKDIQYFHTLFWPAMLEAAGLTRPARVQVHGMLTVNGVKMSKTRGTFINAKTFREFVDPNYLRFFFASRLGPTHADLDLSFQEFENNINSGLVNNFANLISRAITILKDTGRYAQLPAGWEQHQEFVRSRVKAASETYYPGFDSSSAVAAAMEIGSLANKLFQDGEPWKKVKTDPGSARELTTLCLNLGRAAAVILYPVIPEVITRVMGILGLEGPPQSFEEANRFDLVDRPIGTPGRIIDRIDKKQLDKIVEASLPPEAKAQAEADKAAAGKAEAPKAEPKKVEAKKPEKQAPAGPPAEIEIDDFAKIDLRVGLVLSAEHVEGSDKLLKLSVDLGEAKGPRTIFSGIRSAIEASAMVGKKVAVVANLKPRKMRFGTSEGMVLAAGPGGKDIWVLDVPASAPPGSEIK